MGSGPTVKFLDKFSKDEKLFLPHPFLWKVSIDDVSIESINKAVTSAGDKWLASVVPDEYSSGGSILVAQSINLPSEAISATVMSNENAGGFMPGYGISERANLLSRGFSINFLETDKDIEHEYFRPWIVALAVDGLINFKLKATITISQYGNTGNRRKGYVIKGAFPTNSETQSIDYEDDTYKVKSVTFGFSDYSPL